MITIRANDTAAAALGLPFDAEYAFEGQDPGELAKRLQAGGLARDELGALYVPGLSYRQPRIPDFPTLTDRECWMNSWHLDEHPDVRVNIDDDGTPHIGEDGQVHMLRQGITLSRIARHLARRLPDRPSTCCVITVNTTGGVFKLHQARPGESFLPGAIDDHGRPHPLFGLSMIIEITDHIE